MYTYIFYQYIYIYNIMIGSGKNKKKRQSQSQGQRQRQRQLRDQAQRVADPMTPNPLIQKYNGRYCPEVDLSANNMFSIFRRLILTSIRQGPYQANQLQICREPINEVTMLENYGNFLNGTNPDGKYDLYDLIEKDSHGNNIKPPINFNTLFHIPKEIINKRLFLRQPDNINYAGKNNAIMDKIANSLNNTNCGCRKYTFQSPETPCPDCKLDVDLAILTHCPSDPCFVDHNANPSDIELLLPIDQRPNDANRAKIQVTINETIKDAVIAQNRNPGNNNLTLVPFYIAINLFNSSNKTASHTASIIVHNRQLYSVGMANWASDNPDYLLTHFGTQLDAKISSPEDYTTSILYAIQDGVRQNSGKKKQSGRIAVQNYQIIDIGFVTLEMCNKFDEYCRDMVQIKATPKFEYNLYKKNTVITGLSWEPELTATPSALTYQRINNCVYKHVPLEAYGTGVGAAVGACIGTVCGGPGIGTGVGAAVGTVLASRELRFKQKEVLEKRTQPTKTVALQNPNIVIANCSGFIENIFGINCSKVVGKTAGLASAPINCWLRVSVSTIKTIVNAIGENNVARFAMAIKAKTMFGNPWFGGKTNNKRKLTKNRKTRKHFRKTNKTRKN